MQLRKYFIEYLHLFIMRHTYVDVCGYVYFFNYKSSIKKEKETLVRTKLVNKFFL